MITTHFDIVNERRSVMLIIIEKDNLERMKQADPITIEGRSLGGQIMPKVMFPENLSLLIAYEEDQDELYRVCRTKNALLILGYLERGRRWKPDVDGIVAKL